MVGIIYDNKVYKEKDAIVFLYTKIGDKKYFVNSGSLVSSKIHRFVQELTKVRYEEVKGRIIFKNIVNDYYYIRSHKDALFISYKILIFVKTFGEHVKNKETFYNFLDYTLALIEQKTDPKLVYHMFLLKLTYLLGIEPNFKKCLYCQSSETTNFVKDAFEFSCGKCGGSSKEFTIFKKIYFLKKGELTHFLKENKTKDIIEEYLKKIYKELLNYSI